jgi:hypothetical protein
MRWSKVFANETALRNGSAVGTQHSEHRGLGLDIFVSSDMRRAVLRSMVALSQERSAVRCAETGENPKCFRSHRWCMVARRT